VKKLGEPKLIAVSLVLTGVSLAMLPFIKGTADLSWSGLFHPEGRPWRLGIKNARATSEITRTVELTDAALAVSGGYGTTFEPTGRFHHIFDPATGASAGTLLDVAVIAPRATIADGLSTAIYVAGEARGMELLAYYPGARALITRASSQV
jgi:thiamine biosynthesis lipoprotein